MEMYNIIFFDRYLAVNSYSYVVVTDSAKGAFFAACQDHWSEVEPSEVITEMAEEIWKKFAQPSHSSLHNVVYGYDEEELSIVITVVE